MVRWSKHAKRYKGAFLNRATAGEVSVFEARDLAVILQDFVDFDPEIPPALQMSFCHSAIAQARKERWSRGLTGLLESLDLREHEILSKPSSRYCLITKISLGVPYPGSIRRVQTGKTLRIGLDYPARYRISEEARTTAEQRAENPFPLSFPWLSAFVDAKTKIGAANRAVRFVDRFRGLWALSSGGAGRVTFGDKSGPLAQIQTSPVYFLFNTDEPEVGELLWEASRRSSPKRKYRVSSWQRMRDAERWYESMLSVSCINERLEDFLVRYPAALDEPDRSNSLTKVWAALEKLVGLSGNDYGKVIKRLTAIFDAERGEHETLLLNVIRRRRNDIIHTMDADTHDSEFVGALCSLVRTVFPKLVLISTKLESPRDFDDFLELPKELAVLERQKDLREFARSFRQPNPS